MGTRRRCRRRLLSAAALLSVFASVAQARAASIVVDTTAESPGTAGDCTLGEAILAANTDSAVDGCAAGSGADTITLPAGTYTLATVVSTAAGESAFVVGTAITIVGLGATLARDPGVTDLRFFEVTTTGDLTLDRLTLSGGQAQGAVGTSPLFGNGGPGGPGHGGAIHNGGRLTLVDGVLAGNRAAGGSGGNGGTSQSSSGGAGGPGRGGAVYNTGDLTVLRTTFLDNVAAGGRGGHGFQDGAGGPGGEAQGGALCSAAGGTLTLDESDLLRNAAQGAASGVGLPAGLFAGPAGPGTGGAVFSAGGAMLNRCVLEDNTATGGGASRAGTATGGAVAAVAGTLALTRCTIAGNTVIGGPHSARRARVARPWAPGSTSGASPRTPSRALSSTIRRPEEPASGDKARPRAAGHLSSMGR